MILGVSELDVKRGVMTILGIDPGWHITGYGILRKDERAVVLLDYGYLSMSTIKNTCRALRNIS